MVNVDDVVAQAKAAYRAGRSSEARSLLLQAVRHDPNHQDAWLWLSGLVETLEEQRACLENVLALNPAHERAHKGLEAIERQIAARDSQPAEPPASEPAPASEWSAAPTSVEWRRDDSAAVYGSGKQVALPTQDEYDAWVDELHLGAEDAPSAPMPPFLADTPSGPFGDTTYMFDPGPFLDDSALAPRPGDRAPDSLRPGLAASARWPQPAAEPAPAAEIGDQARIWPAPEPAAARPAPQAPKRTRHEFSFDEDDEPEAPEVDVEPAYRPPVKPAALAPEPPPVPREPQRAAQRSAGSEGYFAYIPAEITAETEQRRSRLLTVALVVLIVANLVAAAALLSAL